MHKNSLTYNFFQKASAAFMIVTLCWLTVSTPFIIAGQQEFAKMEKMSDAKCCNSEATQETDNPLGTTNEEKTPGASISFSEEYLHEYHDNHYFISSVSPYNKCDNADTYHAYHGELLVPPPDAV